MIIGLKEFKKANGRFDPVFKKLTHLHLENKGIEVIENLDKCTNLMTIYMQENSIYTLVNNPFQGLSKITQLSLYDNKISKIEGFKDLVSLKKLYLEKNLIYKLEGLENCQALEELNLNNQLVSDQMEF